MKHRKYLERLQSWTSEVKHLRVLSRNEDITIVIQLSYLSTLENSVWDEPEHYVQII